jgi:exosortase
MILVQILFLSVLGPGAWWLFAAPLLYLFFLVPFGEFLVPGLQSFTVQFFASGLHLFGIRNFVDGVVIEIPEGSFYVAEACAGLRFLIASLAFGALYACLMYKSPIRRSVFLALSLIVPVIANGVRALGIISIAHFVGSAEAVNADHVLYGWIFFSLVTFLLILIGLPFRESTFVAPRRASPVQSGAIAMIGARPVFASLRAEVAEPLATRSINVGAGAAEQRWSETEFALADHYTIVASALWVNGRPANGIAGRIDQALNTLRGSPVSPVTAVFTYSTTKPPDDARRAMNRLLAKTTSLSNLIGRMSMEEARSVPTQ